MGDKDNGEDESFWDTIQDESPQPDVVVSDNEVREALSQAIDQ